MSIFISLDVLSDVMPCLHVTFGAPFLPTALLPPLHCSKWGGRLKKCYSNVVAEFFLKYLRTVVFICDSNMNNVTVYYCSSQCYSVKYEALKHSCKALVEKQTYCACMHLLVLQ